MGKGNNNKNKNLNQPKKPVNEGLKQSEKGTPAGGPTEEQMKDYENAESKIIFNDLVNSMPRVNGDPEIGYGAITPTRWHEAQIAERKYHNFSYGEGLAHYHNSYKHYFHHVGLGFDLHGLNVIEIGPADFPALYYCHNFKQGIVIEPMNSVHLRNICELKGLKLITELVENLNFDMEPLTEGMTEVWLFNVMQHIADPEKFIPGVKYLADRIRFFEPIDQPIEVHHPQSYTIKDFQDWFGDCVQLYAGGHISGFHTANCAYGVWIK